MVDPRSYGEVTVSVEEIGEGVRIARTPPPFQFLLVTFLVRRTDCFRLVLAALRKSSSSWGRTDSRDQLRWPR